MTKKRPLTLEEALSPSPGGASAEVQAWHDAQTRKAIEEADAGKFATQDQLQAIVDKYRT
ncbi:MAG: hypothetical protein AAFY02_07775 [Pseudomonadota bacterium]